jgi:hypothetical protein
MLAHLRLRRCPQCGSSLHKTCVEDRNHINGLQIFNKAVDPTLLENLGALLRDLHGLLLAHLLKTNDKFMPLMYRVRVLGTDEASAKPWIVVYCPPSAVKNTEAFFQDDLAREACAEADVAVVFVGPLRFKSLWNEVDVAFAMAHTQIRPPWSGPIVLTQLSSNHYATMGGVLVIKDSEGLESVAGVTVGHLLRHENATGSSSMDVDFDASNAAPTMEGENASGHRTKALGRIAEASFSASARNLDWALIEFLEGTTVSDFGIDDSTYEQYIAGHCMGPVRFRPDFLSPGTAHISDLPAYVILPQGETFVKVHPVTVSGIDSTYDYFSVDPTNVSCRLRASRR